MMIMAAQSGIGCDPAPGQSVTRTRLTACHPHLLMVAEEGSKVSTEGLVPTGLEWVE